MERRFTTPNLRCANADATNFGLVHCAMNVQARTSKVTAKVQENFNTGYNDMCICTSGYDISTGCTTCLPGIAGAFCQTDLCSYTFHEALDANAVNLNNIVIAYNHEQVLYDGIKSAGDGRIPLSMQNTFALRDDKLWWLNETTRQYVHDTSHMPLRNRNVHRLKGEWLSSIQESQKSFKDQLY